MPVEVKLYADSPNLFKATGNCRLLLTWYQLTLSFQFFLYLCATAGLVFLRKKKCLKLGFDGSFCTPQLLAEAGNLTGMSKIGRLDGVQVLQQPHHNRIYCLPCATMMHNAMHVSAWCFTGTCSRGSTCCLTFPRTGPGRRVRRE